MQGNGIHNQEKSQSIKTDLKMTEMMESTDTDIKRAFIIILKDLKGDINIMKKGMEDIRENQVDF